jgi:ribosomal protein S18 acetylase RimI-like enzyme
MQSVTSADVQAIAALDMELFPNNSFNERTLAREVDAGGGIVIYEKGELVSYLLARWDWEIMDITRFGVRPSHQGRGLGNRMLLDVLGSTKLDTILCVEKTNSRAVRMYLGHHFRIIGQLKKSWLMHRSTL